MFLPPEAFVGWWLPDAITKERTAEVLANLSARGFERTGEHYPANYRNNDRLVFDDPALASALFEVLRERLPRRLDANGLAAVDEDENGDIEGGRPGDANEDRWELCGLNPRFRACRYVDGQSFRIHRDGPHAPADDVRSFLTVQLYLDDDPARVGGLTRFYADPCGETAWASITPRAGAAIVFDHRAWHDGEPVTEGIKHVLRTDAMYRRVRGSVLVESATEHDIVGRHRGYAWQAIARRDGSLASAGRDGTVRFWTGTPNHSTEQFADLARGSITCIAEDAAGRVWCGTRTGEIVVIDAVRRGGSEWRASAGTRATALGAITSAVSANGIVAFTTSRGEIVAFDAGSSSSTEAPTWVVQAHDGWAWSITQHGDGFLSCGHDGRIMRIDRDGRARAFLELGTPVRAIGSTLRDGRSGSTMRDAQSNERETHAGVHEPIAVVGDERGWMHWLARDGSVVRSRRAHAAAITAIAVRDVVVPRAVEPTARSAANPLAIVSASEDGTVKHWSSSAAPTILLETHDFVTSVAFDARGDVIAAGYDGAVRRIRST